MLPRAFIFDLDDTLVHASLDFVRMRQDIQCPQDQDILTYVKQLKAVDEDAGLMAMQIIEQHEVIDAYSSQWIDGAQAFVNACAKSNLPLAIVTRNCRTAAHTKIAQNQIPIAHVVTREDAPPKPDPTALLDIARHWQIAPQHIAYVGDYIYDIEAAHRAGMQAWSYGYRTERFPIAQYFECYAQLRTTWFGQ